MSTSLREMAGSVVRSVTSTCEASPVPRCGTDASSCFVYGSFGDWKISRTEPRSTMRPLFMTMTFVARSATTPMSCVMITIALLRRWWSLRSRSRISAWIVTSSAVVGSSAMSMSGSHESDCAIIARWR